MGVLGLLFLLGLKDSNDDKDEKIRKQNKLIKTLTKKKNIKNIRKNNTSLTLFSYDKKKFHTQNNVEICKLPPYYNNKIYFFRNFLYKLLH